MRARRSIRAYTDREVPDELLRRLVEAARWAPSAVNSQPWSFVAVKEPGLVAAIGGLADFGVFNGHVRRSRAIIVICSDPRGNPYHDRDCAFAAQNILLEAHALGLGACYVGAFRAAGIKALLDVPDALEITGLVTLGWPAEWPDPPPRLGLDEILKVETYTGAPPTRWRRLTQTGFLSLWKRVRRGPGRPRQTDPPDAN
jgi:nitroreductase